jgi:hypothetical protein
MRRLGRRLADRLILLLCRNFTAMATVARLFVHERDDEQSDDEQRQNPDGDLVCTLTRKAGRIHVVCAALLLEVCFVHL